MLHWLSLQAGVQHSRSLDVPRVQHRPGHCSGCSRWGCCCRHGRCSRWGGGRRGCRGQVFGRSCAAPAVLGGGWRPGALPCPSFLPGSGAWTPTPLSYTPAPCGLGPTLPAAAWCHPHPSPPPFGPPALLPPLQMAASPLRLWRKQQPFPPRLQWTLPPLPRPLPPPPPLPPVMQQPSVPPPCGPPCQPPCRSSCRGRPRR